MMIRASMLCLVLGLVAQPASARDALRGSGVPRAFNDRQTTGCEAFGPGYLKLAGSDTCVRVSGSVRAEVSVSSGPGARLDRR